MIKKKKTALILFSLFAFLVVENIYVCRYIKKLAKQSVRDYYQSNYVPTAVKEKWNVDFKQNIRDKNYIFRDIAFSDTVRIVAREFRREYNKSFGKIQFQKDDVVLDIGANVGMVSILLAKENPNIKVYSFEPCTRNFENLSYNVKANDVQNVNVFHYGLGAKSETLDFNIDVLNSGASSAFMGVESNSPFAIKDTIEVRNINKPLSEHGIDKIKFFKIDCEGCEFDVFESLSDEKLSNIEYLLAEIHDLKDPKKAERWAKIKERLYKNIQPSKIQLVYS